jgi:rare lipoprotein A
MSEGMMNDAGAKRETVGRRRSCAGVLAVTLVMTASLVASPAVKKGMVSLPGSAKGGDPKAGDGTAKRHWYQIGKASWYGGRFNGRETANGETYDMYGLTCAHRTLPLGSWVRVTNLINLKTAFLRVNDRGPMAANLIVDLSFGAAQRLGVDGLAKVRIEPINFGDPKLAEQLVAQMHLVDDPARMMAAESSPSLGMLASINR